MNWKVLANEAIGMSGIDFSQDSRKAAAAAKRKAKRKEKAEKRAMLKEFFGDDPDFCKVIIEDYHLKG